MASHFLLLLLFTTLSLNFMHSDARGRSRPSSATPDETVDVTETVDDTNAATTDATSADDDYVTLVKGYLDDGTCPSTSATTVCGDDATSYYKEFEYNGQRVVIANGIPDHDAETDAVHQNPNERCEIWQFMAVPLEPTKVRLKNLLI